MLFESISLLRLVANELGLIPDRNQLSDDVIRNRILMFAQEAAGTEPRFTELGTILKPWENVGIRDFLKYLAAEGHDVIINDKNLIKDWTKPSGKGTSRTGWRGLTDLLALRQRNKGENDELYTRIALDYVQKRDKRGTKSQRIIRLSILGNVSDPDVGDSLKPYLYSNYSFYGNVTNLQGFKGNIVFVEYKVEGDGVVDVIGDDCKVVNNIERVATVKHSLEPFDHTTTIKPISQNHEMFCGDVVKSIIRKRLDFKEKVVKDSIYSARNVDNIHGALNLGRTSVCEENQIKDAIRVIGVLEKHTNDFPPDLRDLINEAQSTIKNDKTNDLLQSGLFRVEENKAIQFGPYNTKADLIVIHYPKDEPRTVRVEYAHLKVDKNKVDPEAAEDILELLCNASSTTPKNVLANLKANNLYISYLVNKRGDNISKKYYDNIKRFERAIEGKTVGETKYDKIEVENRFYLFECYDSRSLKGTMEDHCYEITVRNVCVGRSSYQLESGSWSRNDSIGIEGLEKNVISTQNMKIVREKLYTTRRKLYQESTPHATNISYMKELLTPLTAKRLMASGESITTNTTSVL